tara:strand:+ start:50 stop:310 length:261 start_codon:yes stop_codon:yes gene_type:complete
MDERIESFWIQESRTGRTDPIDAYSDNGRSMLQQQVMGMTTYMDKGIIHDVPMHFAMMKLLNDSQIAKSAERYFNKITRNNQGNVK